MRGADFAAQSLQGPSLIDGRLQPPLCLGLRPLNQSLPAGGSRGCHSHGCAETHGLIQTCMRQ